MAIFSSRRAYFILLFIILEKTGLLKGKWEKLLWWQERQYYYITEMGQEALNERLVVWRGFSEAVELIMLLAT